MVYEVKFVRSASSRGKPRLTPEGRHTPRRPVAVPAGNQEIDLKVSGNWIWWALAVMLAWAPVPLASNRPWALGVLAVAAWVLLLSMLVVTPHGWRGVPSFSIFATRRAALPWVFWSGFCVLVASQLLAGDAGTADASATRQYLLQTLTYGAAFFVVQQLSVSEERVLGMLGAIVGAGVLQACIAIVLHAEGGKYDFLFDEFEQGGRATGTFPNPDHLAAYMELCLSAGVGMLFAQFGGEPSGSRAKWIHHARSSLTFLMSRKMLLRLMLVLLVITLVMTRSRMGNGAFFLSLLMVGTTIVIVSRRLRKPALILVISMTIIDVVIIGQWVGLERVVARLESTPAHDQTFSPPSSAAFAFGAQPDIAPAEETFQERMRVPLLSIKLISHSPWFGHGGGSFYTVLPPYKTEDLPWQWNHAHNDYAEIASDTGLVGLALWVGMGLLTGIRAVWLLRDSQPRLSRGVGAAALMALFAMSIHIFVDFVLQIPANAITLSVILALAWSVPLYQSSKNGRRSTQLPV